MKLVHCVRWREATKFHIGEVNMGAPAIVAVSILNEERHTVDAFRRAGATSAARARTLAELGLAPTDAPVRRFVRAGVVQRSASGTFYLDEVALARREQGRPRRVLVLIAAIVVGGLAVLLAG